MDRMRLYDLIYAFAARDGREARLFGNSAPRAREAFARSLAGDSFPELWFELPLAGEPWFDLHALTAREDLAGQANFDATVCAEYPEVLAWFAAQGPSARQLALSWDTGSGRIDNPAVQLLKRTDDTQLTCDFLTAARRPDAVEAYRAFESHLPADWFACYTGVFPTRKEPFLRVECIPSLHLQHAYATDYELLAAHFQQVGLDVHNSEELLERCQALAATPFRLEFQFDVTPEGTAGRTFSASVRFDPPTKDQNPALLAATAQLMRRVEAWGLTDSRWRMLPQTFFSKRVTHEDESCLLYCFPAFVKLRWRDGKPLDAKSYLMAGVQA